MATATMMDVPESQRLIALSLGKIAASRGQKGGINLHKNLLVATVLTKARAAYMIQHMNAAKQRVAATTSHPSSPAPPTSSTCVEMKEAKPEPTSSAASSTTTTTTSTTSSATSSAAAPTALHSSPTPTQAAPQSVTPLTEAASVPEGAAGSRMQVAEIEDKENTPPPSSPCRGDVTSPSSSSSLDCEKRLQGEPCVDIVKEGKPALSSRAPVSHGQHSNSPTNTRDYVSRPSSTCCLLKRRRAMDRDHENVSAPKVRIVEARVSDSTTTTPEPMQCDSPQISNLVNIFNTSFSGLSGASGAGGDVSVRSVGQSILSSVSTHHKLSDSNNLTCAKEITKVGLDSLHHPLVLSV